MAALVRRLMAFPENVWSSRNGLAVRLAFGAVFRSFGVSDEWHLDVRKSAAANEICKKASLA